MGGLFAASGAAVQQDLGTAQAPVHVTQADPSFRAQFWRTVRSLGLAFIVISGIGALMEDKGVPSRFMSGGGEIRPVLDSNTKFEDVKGVDEAKQVRRREMTRETKELKKKKREREREREREKVFLSSF